MRWVAIAATIISGAATGSTFQCQPLSPLPPIALTLLWIASPRLTPNSLALTYDSTSCWLKK